jgi:hypothetical protein
MAGQVPTLGSIEAGWLGPVAEGVSRGQDRTTKVHTVTNDRVCEVLKAQIVTPYALCDANGRLVCFLGVDKVGDEMRVYDILALHEEGRPDDGVQEQYDGRYLDVITLRQHSKTRYDVLACSAEPDVKIRALREARVTKDMLDWAQKQVVVYMNRYFGVVADTQSSVVMKRVTTMEEPPAVIGLAYNGFIRTYGNHKVAGDKQRVSNMWYDHDDRRTFDGLGFGERVPPNFLNLWTGLRPIPDDTDIADADIFFEYVYHLLCKREGKVFTYLVHLLAHMMQYPFVKTETCVGMKGDQGSGKSVLVDGVLRPIFRQYCTTVTMEDLKRFNGFLKHTLIAFLDEAVPQDDKVAIAKYKSLVTSPKLRLEDKHLSSYELPNYINPIVTTNWDIGGILEHDDRRLLLLDVSNERADVSIPANKEYWDTLWGRLNPDAIHKALLEIPSNGFSLRVVPMTKGKREQKLMTLKTPILWYINLLEEGSSTMHDDMALAKEAVYGEYVRWFAKSYPSRKPDDNSRFWPLLRDLLGDAYEEPARQEGSSGYARQFVIPSREVGRAAVCRYLRDPAFFC